VELVAPVLDVDKMLVVLADPLILDFQHINVVVVLITIIEMKL
jgi:hypothetical protein